MLFCTDTTANSNHTQPLHMFEINIIGSAAITAFVKVAALIRYDFDFVNPGASTCLQLTNVLVIVKFKAMAFDTIWQGLSKMDSGIIATLVVKTDSIAISALRIDIYCSDSREFTAEVVLEFFNVIMLASGVTMAGSNQISLMNVLIPWIKAS